ncbi:RNA-directed DNA polymerase from mobile element jockey-like [Plakobranchus ocellatus]|uniref:RNA-directed DNA polymerase from mobile element jockey-like n=1 Tax=Plakobranchus ocellatus TaxID=259542 RepID=A0AAV3Y5N6_9GAST|nr:RNA-directed DNA polymerase from mobile element jockey-like [Plakobranchus ocellatus]
MEDRRKTKADEQKYRELDKQVKKRCNEAKKHWIDIQRETIEANTRINSKTMHQKIKEITGKKVSARTGCLRARDGDIVIEKEDILNRWSECISELYHDDRGPPPIISNEDEKPHILEEEVQKALKKMKKDKAAGPDDIPSKMLTALGEFGIKEVTKLLNTIHATGIVKVRQTGLFDILIRHNCDGKDLKVIRNIYWEQEVAIRVDNDCSEYRPICRGVRGKNKTSSHFGLHNNRCGTEIQKRNALSKDTFTKMKPIFTNRNIRSTTKINTMKAYIWPILLYGCECWTPTKDLERRLKAAEMWYIRRIMRISWTERK